MVANKNDIKKLIISNQEAISRYGAKSLGLFGSFVRNEATQDSDVDLIVDFLPGSKNYDNFISLAYFLEKLFGRKVELVTESSISKYLKPYIVNTAEYVNIS